MEMKEKLQFILENSPVFWCYVDRDRRYQLMNHKYVRLFKKSMNEMIGKYVWEIIDQSTYDSIKEKIDLVLAGHNVHYQSTLYDMQNNPRHYSGELMPDLSSEGEVQGFYGMFQDITDAKALEQESKELRERLEQLDRISTVHVMSSAIAHEINQPLSAILSNAQAGLLLLDMGCQDMDEVKEILRDIEHDDRRASAIINRLRYTFTKEGQADRKFYNIIEIIKEVIHMVQAEFITRKARIKTDFTDDLPRICCDRVQIQQALMNFFFNALDALEHCPPPYRLIRIAAWKDERSLFFSVTDSGQGIDPEELDFVFQPFYTRKRQGIGLGLAICRYIIEDHEGRIWAELPREGGFRVVVSLPAAFEEPE